MSIWPKLIMIAFLAAVFLVADMSLAIPVQRPTDATVSADEGTSLARRRRRRRKKPKPKPKPKPVDAPAPEPDPAMAPAPTGGGARLSRTTRIEFDAQLIKGQTTKAGEVQILERKDTALKSMVKRRTSFRDEIIRSVFPEK
ncbi:MAG: hypothetical protein JRJ19_07340 [Deltaproteobacteria bacterium]|nr:hypothetical protein [Deltaproteobacteria bacterium]